VLATLAHQNSMGGSMCIPEERSLSHGQDSKRVSDIGISHDHCCTLRTLVIKSHFL
jgi:hypothetical protein